jgi:hypothetical protein
VDGRRILSRNEEGSKYARRELKDFNRLRGSSLTTMLLCYAEPEFGITEQGMGSKKE